MRKEEELIEIQKRKMCTSEETSELEENFVESVSFLFLYCIFWYLQVCLLIEMWYLYICVMVILCNLFFDFLIEKDENILMVDMMIVYKAM